MVEGKVFRRIFRSAVLTEVFVALVDVGAGKPHFTARAPDLDELEQTEDRRKPEGEGNTTDIPVIGVDHLHLALSEQGDRPLPGNDF